MKSTFKRALPLFLVLALLLNLTALPVAAAELLPAADADDLSAAQAEALPTAAEALPAVEAEDESSVAEEPLPDAEPEALPTATEEALDADPEELPAGLSEPLKDTETKAAAAAAFLNVSDDGGANQISLCVARDFQALIPLEKEVSLEGMSLSLVRDASKEYNDPELYPYQKQGGTFDSFLANGNVPFFTEPVIEQKTIDGQLFLVVSFSNVPYFGSDNSAPHSSGGAYLDTCGYFNLTAKANDSLLGSVSVKIAPYDGFHTMSEIYEALDDMVAFAAENTDLYVKKFSMGESSGDIYDPLDMPYIIVADKEDTVLEWLDFTEAAETDPTAVLAGIEAGDYDSIRVPVMYSNIHSNEVAASDGVIAFAWMLLEAAAEDGALDYNTLLSYTDEGQEALEAQMEAERTAVPDLVKDSATYLGYLSAANGRGGASGKTSDVIDLDAIYNQTTITVDLDELLEDVFFILVPEENVEGRTYVTRTASNGYDLNRDNSFQTTSETSNMQKLIGAFNPVSLTEFHGRVRAFQCEPCDPPHEPNFEYDLLAKHLIPGGEALGIAAVANNDTYNSYVIPQRDYLTQLDDETTYWSDPWDDMSTSYTPQFAMLQGTVAYTVELPGYNDPAVNLVKYGCLGQSDYIAGEKLGYLAAQVEIYERGTQNFNSDAYDLAGQWFCDQYDVEGAEMDLFRPEFSGNGNFYPECYIIPMDGKNQSNLQAAYDMMVWLSRNDVKLLVTDSSFKYNGTTYPEGTMIVSMYQAKRSVANSALYDGTLITSWTVLYSEGITSFNETRGFDMEIVDDPETCESILKLCGDPMDYEDCLTYVGKLGSSLKGLSSDYVVISNASEDSTAAVNALLKDGKKVSMITDKKSVFFGDFLCSFADWSSVANDYVLSGTGLSTYNLPEAHLITKAPVVFINGASSPNSSGFLYASRVGNANWNYDRRAMDLMGFETTENPEEATVVVGASRLSGEALTAVLNGTPYIGYGSSAANGYASLFGQGAVTRSGVARGSMDCLGYVTYPNTTLVNASYVMDEDDVLYGYGAGYFSSIPEDATVLVKMDGSKTPTEGFLVAITDEQKEQCDAYLNDSVQAFAYQGTVNDSEINVVLFANSLTHKVHQRDEFAFISNFAFSTLLGDVYPTVNPSSGGSSGGSSSGSSSTTPAEPTSTEPATTEPATSTGFADVKNDAWFAKAVAFVKNANLMNGISDDAFEPDGPMSRAMVVTVLYRLAGAKPVASVADFTDVEADQWYSDAIAWASANGIAKGYDTGAFGVNDTVNREQLVTFFHRYAKLMEYDVSVGEDTNILSYDDAFDISEWAMAAFQWACGSGVVQGVTESALAPQADCSRAQVAEILMRFDALTAPVQ